MLNGLKREANVRELPIHNKFTEQRAAQVSWCGKHRRKVEALVFLKEALPTLRMVGIPNPTKIADPRLSAP